MNALQNAARTPQGVMVNGFVLAPIIDKCEGCDRVRAFEEEKFCSSYPAPDRKWAAKVNPLKASKRSVKKR
jgi:hypothetical protein